MPHRTAQHPRWRPGAQDKAGSGRKTSWRISVMKRAILAGGLCAAAPTCCATAGAQTLTEVTATRRVHHAPATSGTSTALGARDTIMRHLPQPKTNGGDGWGKGSDTRTHATGGFKTRPTTSSPAQRTASAKGWAKGKGWARA